jgi:SAM-dependent methyltransferase
MSQPTPVRPAPFSVYTTPEFWGDPHISAQMLAHHLDSGTPYSSRPHEFIDRSAAWIVRRFGVGAGTRVLDLGCGPGLYAQRLARAGAAVTGIDVSVRSLGYARDAAAAEGLDITYLQGSYLDLDLGGPFDLAVLIFEDYCALGPVQRQRLLARVCNALAPGGAMLFDVSAAPRFAGMAGGSVTQENLMDGFFSADDYLGRCDTWLYPELRTVLEHYTITARDSERHFYNWTQFLTADEASGEASEAKFSAVEVLGDVAGAPYGTESGTFAVVATR